MANDTETLADVSAWCRDIARSNRNAAAIYNKIEIEGLKVCDYLDELANRIDAAAKREAESIERIIRDAIIDYQEMYPHAPNDEAERDLIDRANRGNAWLVSHGYEPEKTIWDKEEAPCL